MRGVALVFCLLMAACGPATPDSGINQSISYLCSGQMVLAGGGWVTGDHTIHVFPDGGVIASCEVLAASFEVSAFSLYRASDVGASTAQCITRLDVDTASGGFWVFKTSGDRTTTQVTYNDASSSSNNTTYSLPCKRIDPPK